VAHFAPKAGQPVLEMLAKPKARRRSRRAPQIPTTTAEITASAVPKPSEHSPIARADCCPIRLIAPSRVTSYHASSTVAAMKMTAYITYKRYKMLVRALPTQCHRADA
jgi:hypothetical protein